MAINEAELDQLKQYIESVRWQFAKTMPQWPHWYTVLKWSTKDQSHHFLTLSKSIFNHGYDMTIGKRTYRYLNIGEFKYWSMDPTPESTDLINRAYVDNRKVSPEMMVNIKGKE